MGNFEKKCIAGAASFQNVNKWIEYVREERGTDVLVVLIGNKIDAAEKRYPKQIYLKS